MFHTPISPLRGGCSASLPSHQLWHGNRTLSLAPLPRSHVKKGLGGPKTLRHPGGARPCRPAKPAKPKRNRTEWRTESGTLHTLLSFRCNDSILLRSEVQHVSGGGVTYAPAFLEELSPTSVVFMHTNNPIMLNV